MNLVAMHAYLAGIRGKEPSLFYRGEGNFVPNNLTGMTFKEQLMGAYGTERGVTGVSIQAPESMDGIFEEAARKYGVDVNFLKAIGKAESNFDATCTSSAGAMGVMQLMPGTAEYLGVNDPYDARQNIMGGASYIAGLLRQYGQNTELALAAYNAGSGNVAKYGGVPPFKETQNYIKKVTAYMGQDITTGVVVSGNESQQSEALYATGAEVYAMDKDSVEIWQDMVKLMRAQMDLKLGSAFNFAEEDGKTGI